MTTGQVIVDRSRLSLIDSQKVTWSDVELLGYLNAGIAQACGTLLDLYVRTAMTTLAPGVRQNLPPAGLLLIDIPRSATGKTVMQASKSEFGRTSETWGSDPPSADVKYFFYDRRAPTTFLVYPPASNVASVELVYAATPDPIALGGNIPIAATFDTALWAYTCAMAWAKNTKRQDTAKFTSMMGMFNSILGTWKQIAAGTVKEPDQKGMY